MKIEAYNRAKLTNTNKHHNRQQGKHDNKPKYAHKRAHIHTK